MFGISLPSVSDVTRGVTNAAATALHGAEDLGDAAVAHASSLGRAGLDLGRAAVTAASHVDVQKLGASAIGAIGRAEHAADQGIRSGVLSAGQGVHALADTARSHITGNDPLSRLARAGVTAQENLTRFDIGLVGGAAKAVVGLAGSAGQLGVLAAEYQASPTARAAIDAKVGGAVVDGAKSVAGYAQSVAHDPSRVVGDAAGVAQAGAAWAKGEVKSAEQAIQDGHGPESFGMQAGNAATYLIPVGGEVRLAAEGGEVATRALVTAVVDDGVRATVKDGAEAVVAGAPATAARGAEAIDGLADVAKRTGASEGRLQEVLDTAAGSRPQPSEYLSPERIAEHRAAFDQGASRFSLRTSVEKYGLAQRDGTTFVMTHAAADDVLKAAGDDPRALEKALGLPAGQLEGSELVRVDFNAEAMDDLHVRMPSGNEAGANAQWMPGGLLRSGQQEAVLDGVLAQPGQYSINHVR